MQRALLRAARQAKRNAAGGDCSAAVSPTSRAFSSAFASTSGRSGGEAATHSLAALPVRVRAFINGERLKTALTQLAAIDASAQVRSAVHEARAIYQRRIAAIQRELLRDRADLSHAEMAAPRFVALCNGLLSSNGGRKVMLVGVPLAAALYASTDAAQCSGLETPYLPRMLVAAPATAHRVLLSNSLDVIAEELLTVLRALYLLLLFLPVVVTGPLCAGMGVQRERWTELVRWTLERAGPAFIKWGQWAATRPDMFPQDLCDALAVLQTDSPKHRWEFTKMAVERAFKEPISALFSDFSQQPVASGSIAQIHKATLSERGAELSGKAAGTVVAVKVRHPGVSTMMQRDFVLMQRAAALSTRLPLLRELNLDESVRQFGAPLREQLDLCAEAANLKRFNRNFRKWKNLSFPEPIFPLVTTDVLVESFEEGQLISRYVNSPSNPHNTKLAAIGLGSYLKMLLKDNFIHADLHPGNILVRMDKPDPTSYWGRLLQRLDLGSPEHMVLLDVGMVAELTAEDQSNLVDFFKAISQKDGRALGENILRFSDKKQTCQTPEVFVEDMAEYFEGLSWSRITGETSAVMGDIMEMVRQHQVNLKGVVSTVVVTTLVLEGWSSKLNPDIRILDKLQELLPLSWSERTQKYIADFGSDRELNPRF